MSCIGRVFDINVSCIVNGDFNDFRSFLIFPNKTVVNVDIHFKVDNYLNLKFYDQSNSNNFKPEILFSRARSLVVSDLRSKTKFSRVRLLPMCRGELSTVISRLMSKC